MVKAKSRVSGVVVSGPLEPIVDAFRLVRQALDRPAHRGPGEAQGVGEVDLVEKQASGGSSP